MPIKKLLLISLICMSLNLCNARRLASSPHKKLEKSFQQSIQNIQKGISVRAKEGCSLTGGVQSKADTAQNLKEKEDHVTSTEKPKGTGTISKESLGSVSWRIPHNTRREKHPGFNLDYSPPKVHPPSHN
ncbi:hypothetical protein K2173_013425 [Erythroxylum novogranatense]|uniref:Uncharacterized protein n=1 Tax=Erythroxylum novogranatense TaxID=1862640 RepID=A0AAV8S9T6_9ROSI|nr:hypothetical protein K2173_013425 [Erythroxylum novogranatense]